MLKRILALLFITTLMAQAQPVLIETQIVQATRPMKDRRLSADTWMKMARSGEIKILEESTHASTAPRDSLAHVGGKLPVIYSDPKAGGTQVQYVDRGFKIDVKPHPAGPNQFNVDCRVERAVENETLELGGAEVALFNSSFPMERGQTIVVLTVQGHMVRDFVKQAYPEVKFGPDHRLILAVTLR